MEKPGEGGERWGNQGFFPVSAAFELPARQLGGDDTRVQHYMSPQVLLPPALCLPHRSRLEGEASAGPR